MRKHARTATLGRVLPFATALAVGSMIIAPPATAGLRDVVRAVRLPLGSPQPQQPSGAGPQRVWPSAPPPAPARASSAPRPRRAAPAPRRAVPAAPTNDNFARLRACESGGNYAAVSRGNRYFGAYQMSPSTWRSMGYAGMPHQAPPHVQDEAARRLQARAGWRQWPGCARKLKLS